MAFKYQRRSTEDLERRAAGATGDFQGVIKPEFKVWTPEKGDNYIRILPPTWEDPKHYGLDVYVHYSMGPNNASVLCLAKNLNKRCPICDERQAGRGPLPEKGQRDPLMPVRRVAVWMLNQKEPDKGPMIWLMAQTLDKDIVKVSKDKETGEWYIIEDPEKGYNINFEKEGEQRNTSYVGITISRRPSSVDGAILDYIAEHPLPTCLQYLTYEEIQDIYEGGGGVAADKAEERPRNAGPARDRPGYGQRSGAPAEDPPPPNSEQDYGGNPEPEERPAGGGWKKPDAEAPRAAAGGPSGRPSINPKPETREEPAAKETPANNPSRTASSLRDRFANRNKG